MSASPPVPTRQVPKSHSKPQADPRSAIPAPTNAIKAAGKAEFDQILDTDADLDDASARKEPLPGVAIVETNTDWMLPELSAVLPTSGYLGPDDSATGQTNRPVIVADVDGTLWGDPSLPEGRRLLPRFVARMEEWIESRGLVFVINTGMTFERFQGVFSLQDVPIWPTHALVAETEIYHRMDGNFYVDHQPFNDQSRHARRQVVKQLRPVIDEWVGQWGTQVHILRWQRQKYDVMFMCADGDHARRLERLICQTLSRHGMHHLSVMRNRRMVAIYSGLYSKRRLLAELVRIRGWVPTQVLTIGDDVNDLSMLTKDLSTPACVGNAVQEVQHQVRTQNGYLARAGFGHGALEAIEWFLAHFDRQLASEGHKPYRRPL